MERGTGAAECVEFVCLFVRFVCFLSPSLPVSEMKTGGSVRGPRPAAWRFLLGERQLLPAGRAARRRLAWLGPELPSVLSLILSPVCFRSNSSVRRGGGATRQREPLKGINSKKEKTEGFTHHLRNLNYFLQEGGNQRQFSSRDLSW